MECNTNTGYSVGDTQCYWVTLIDNYMPAINIRRACYPGCPPHNPTHQHTPLHLPRSLAVKCHVTGSGQWTEQVQVMQKPFLTTLPTPHLSHGYNAARRGRRGPCMGEPFHSAKGRLDIYNTSVGRASRQTATGS